MTTRALYDIHSDFFPDDSDHAWAEPLSVLTSNKLYDTPVMRIDDDRTDTGALTVLAGFAFAFQVPADYVSGSVLRVWWVSSKTTGDVRWQVAYTPVASSGESVDPAAATTTVAATASTAATAWHQNMTDLALTGIVAGDRVLVNLQNDGTHVADTLTGARMILAVDFVYDDGV